MASGIFSPSDDRLDVDLLVLPDASMLSLASTMEPLRAANRASGRTLYRYRLLSPDGRAVMTSGQLPIPVEAVFDPDDIRDTLIVVAAFNIFRHSTPALMAGLRRVARRGVPIGGVEAGAWVIALAGLLNGCRATTHWEDLEEFAARFPDVDVRPDRFVIDGARFTTGGASPALELMLNLIRARQGYALALDVASIFIYDQSRAPEDPQPIVSVGRLDWNEPRVAKAIRIMEARIEQPLPIPAIAKRSGVSARTMEILFLQTVGMAPRDYYLAMRLNAGRRLILDGRKSMTEIAATVGFGSASAFARAFRNRFGESPRETRRRRSLDSQGPAAKDS
ncbi:GlxA family transcriptional regulator [Rhodospirillaceae bacterium SYSU D60014]|uniref:GlxA family transcriptional regulator n=1 Tax=Virgifigura deserti TaxID=2268457 RepID=UPI000E6708E4